MRGAENVRGTLKWFNFIETKPTIPHQVMQIENAVIQ